MRRQPNSDYVKNDNNLFRDVFFINLAMVISPINVIFIIYWAIKKNKRSLKIGLATFSTMIIILSAALSAVCFVYKVPPAELFKNGKFYIEQESLIDPNGYLEVGGRMLQISSDENLVLSYDAEKVVLYAEEDTSRVVLYEDSGIEVKNATNNDLAAAMIEDPAEFFDVYNEEYKSVSEMIEINKKMSYVSYTQGAFENIESEEKSASNGTYTEVCILQDIGVRTYLRIRIADYTGEAPTALIAKYALTVPNIIA